MYVMMFGLLFSANNVQADVIITGPLFSTYRECVEAGSEMTIRSDVLPLTKFIYRCVELKKT